MEIPEYKIGDVVRIVDEDKLIPTLNCGVAAKMKEYAGCNMTIRDITEEEGHIYYWMEEDVNDIRYNSGDKDGWMWIPGWIAGLAKDDISEQDVLMML